MTLFGSRSNRELTGLNGEASRNHGWNSGASPARKKEIGTTVFLYVIVGVFCFAMGLFAYKICSRHPEPAEIKISVLAPSDTIKFNDYLYMQQALDSIAKNINRQEEELNRTYNLFMKARNDDAEMMTILSCVGAFILALFAFFGIQSYRDIREKISNDACRVAGDTARQASENYIRSEVRTGISEAINDNSLMNSIKEDVISRVNQNHIVPLANRVSVIEGYMQRIRGMENTSQSEVNTPETIVEIAEDIERSPGDEGEVSTNSDDSREIIESQMNLTFNNENA